MKYPWAVVGAEVCCIFQGPWMSYIQPFPGVIINAGPRPGPAFMSICKIVRVEPVDSSEWVDEGHELWLGIEGFQDDFCVCRFRPLEKLTEEVQDRAKEPV